MCDVCSIATVSFDTILVLDPFLGTMGKGKKMSKAHKIECFFISHNLHILLVQERL